MDIVKVRHTARADAQDDWLLEGMQHLLRLQPRESCPDFHWRNMKYEDEPHDWQV